MQWSRREALVGLGGVLVAGCAGRRGPASDLDRVEPPGAPWAPLDGLLGEHARRYPKMEPADVYKICHQRRMGPGHLVAAGDALAWLEREAAELVPLPAGVEEVDTEVLDRGAGLLRVHLRPWLAQGRSLAALADAFAGTAARWTPRPDLLAAELARVGELLGLGALALGFDRAAWEAFTAPLVAQGLPAVHHSEVYRAAYAPAYSVVLAELIAGA